MEDSEFEKSLFEKQPEWIPQEHIASHTTIRSRCLSDAADFFVLLCSFLLTTASLVLVALISAAQSSPYSTIPLSVISILQRGIAVLSTTVTSAVIMVAGKRYVLFKLSQGGIRSRQAAVYSNPSVGSLTSYMLRHGVEFQLLALLVVWALALATGLTVNDSWTMVSQVNWQQIGVPFGPLDAPMLAAPGSSWVTPAAQQLAFVTGSLCEGVQGMAGLIKMPGVNITTGGPAGIIYYPPRPYFSNDAGFSITTSLNGFTLSIEQLSSVPPTVQNTTCVPSDFSVGNGALWYDDSDNQTLSIVASDPTYPSLFRFNATAIVLGGILSSTGNYTEFAPNGTWWPNAMSSNQWAKDIMSLICNTSLPSGCLGSSLMDFSVVQNGPDPSGLDNFSGVDGAGIFWSTVLGMAMGAYTSAMWPSIGVNMTDVPVSYYSSEFTSWYGIYVLGTNIVVSITMLVIVVRLRIRSHLGPDFLNAIRLLLDPLKDPELFNASLEDTIDALANPSLHFQDGSRFLLVGGKDKAESGEKETDSMNKHMEQ